MPEENNDTETKTRRSQTKKELDAFSQLVAVLKPFDAEQRKRLLDSALSLIGD